MPTIRIDDEVYSWLKDQAVPFEDTPNSVLRRLAGFDAKPSIIGDKSGSETNEIEKGDGGTKAFVNSNQTSQKYLTGKELAQQWQVPVKHALYHRDGIWYNHLRHFPGALFDPNGYVIFNTESEYKNSPYLRHGVELNVVGGIHSIPGYKRMR